MMPKEVIESDNKTSTGFVKLYRDITSQPWYKLHEGRYTAVFVHLLLSASHQPREVTFRNQNITLLPGQIAKTYEQLARELSQSKRNIQSAIHYFKKHGQIDTISNGKFTIICLKNWDKFNDKNGTDFGTVSGTLKPHIKQGLEVVGGTANGTVNGTQNKNVLEQEYNTEPNGEGSSQGEAPNQDKMPAGFYQSVADLYNESFPQLPQCKKLSDARRKAIKARTNNEFDGDLDRWKTYFEYINSNCTWMLTGNYKVDFDYVVRQSVVIKIMEGSKDDK